MTDSRNGQVAGTAFDPFCPAIAPLCAEFVRLTLASDGKGTADRAPAAARPPRNLRRETSIHSSHYEAAMGQYSRIPAPSGGLGHGTENFISRRSGNPSA